ncbi:MAG: putative lipid II flippase FtsW [Patescibacteria group bacterium]
MNRRLLAIILILIVFGLIILSSAGIVDGQKKFGSPYYYLTHQFLYGVIPGLIGMFILSLIDYRFWKKISLFVLVGSLALMIMIFLPNFGHGLKGATRWISFGVLSFQPAEILKLSLIIYLAAWFGNRNGRTHRWSYGTMPFLIVLAFVALLLFLQPDVGTLIIVSLISLGIYFLAGPSYKQFAGILLVLFIGLSAIIVVEPYRFDRLKSFWDPSIDPRGSSYQINQSLISIGSGGLFGVGYNNSSQKQGGFLPEVIGDSIFAIIAEELGLVGSALTVGLFGALCLFLVDIAKNASDKFGVLLVMGINIWIMSQAFVNIAAISGLVPLTGIPLPFISYGGTALAVLLSGMGIVFNIAKKS